MKKRLLIFFTGILVIILGVLSMEDFQTGQMIYALGLVIYGVCSFIIWDEKKKTGTTDSLWLTSPIFSSFSGFFVSLGILMNVLVPFVIIVTLILNCIIEGVMLLAGMRTYRKAMTSPELGKLAPGHVLSTILGFIIFLYAVLGIVMFLYPVEDNFEIISIIEYLLYNYYLGVGLIFLGSNLILTSHSVAIREDA